MKQGTSTRKFYRFEEKITGALDQERSMASLQRLAVRIWANERPARPMPRVVSGRGARGAGRLVSYWQGDPAHGTHRIVLSRQQRNVGVLLHELAHAMVWRGQPHGPAFARCCLYLHIQYARVPLTIIDDAIKAHIL